MMKAPPMWRLPAYGVRTLRSSRSAFADVCVTVWRSKRSNDSQQYRMVAYDLFNMGLLVFSGYFLVRSIAVFVFCMIERALGCSTFGDLQSHSWPCSRSVCFAVHFFAFHEGAGVSLTGLPQFLIYKYTRTSCSVLRACSL